MNNDKLISELRRARNELCEQCGNYKDAHNGACDGCHWKDEWREDTQKDNANKATIIQENGKYRYFDKNGTELCDGDFIRCSSGIIEKLYAMTDGMLGIDATNPSWIASGRAVECEYGIYPLNQYDMSEIVKA